ncbi:sorting nexin-7-like [Cylas formicarius]|uniref:sorting nexin-7-like n=1 Tax=Cylas formicarius TaxID=197179 RepID=UPI002958872C|nr:sorting nexin-7-like [Cylas formicarius]
MANESDSILLFHENRKAAEQNEGSKNNSCINSESSVHNSMAQSPSLDSFSTINDIDNLDLNVDVNPDFYVKVDNPERQLDTLETYITFQITTTVQQEDYHEGEYVVRRRYNDFLWLRQKLAESHPFCIIAPLPAKHSLIGQLDRYDKKFIMLRMKSLNVFISRVCSHPVLSHSPHLKVFLTAKTKDFSASKGQKTQSERQNSGSLHSSVSESTNPALKGNNFKFDRIKAYLNTLSEKLSSIEKISNRINKERIDLVAELTNFHPYFATWAESEPQLSDTLERVSGAIREDAESQSALIHSYPADLGYCIKEFLQYIEVVQATLKKREALQHTYQMSLEELNRKRADKEKLVAISQETPAAPPPATFSLWKQPKSEEKLEKLITHIPGLLKRTELDHENLELASDILRGDLHRWQLEKQRFLKKTLLDFVNKQIMHYERSVGSWQNVTAQLTQLRNATDGSSVTK